MDGRLCVRRDCNRREPAVKVVIRQIMRACTVLALALAGACQDGGAAGPGASPTAGDFTEFYESRLQEVSSIPGSARTSERGVIRVDVPAGRAIYFFTTPGHAAHPAIVKRTVVERDGRVMMQTEGWTDGPNASFEDWLGAFQEQDEQIRQQFQQ